MGTANRIYLSVNGEGYGHASRAIAIAHHLAADEVLIGGYGYALAKVRSHSLPGVEVPQEVEFFGADGRFNVTETILKNPKLALEFNGIIEAEMKVMTDHDVAVVVADGRIAPMIAADRLEIPCVVLTNQSSFFPFFARESELVQILGRSFDYVMSRWLRGAEEILIPDFPAPNTVSLYNLSSDRRVKMRTRFVGPLTPWTAGEVVAQPHDGARRLIVASLGGHKYRKPLFDAVVEAARALPEHRFVVLSSFQVDPAVAPASANIEFLEPVKDAAPWFKAADLVITQAGHSSAMELLSLGTATVVVPDENQIEQEHNARRLEELQTSIFLNYTDLQHPEQFPLRRAIELILRDPSYTVNAEKLAKEAERLTGAATTAGILRHYAQRLSAY